MDTAFPPPTPWLVCPQPRPQARVRLLCAPYAGAGAQVFRPWSQALPDWIEVHALELPGRGRRWSEPPCTSLQTLAQALAPAIQPFLDKPFALFGHSMGAWICFELAQQLQSANACPERLFLSGRRAPQVPTSQPPLHRQSEAQLRQTLVRLKGTPAEILDNHELLNLLLPILRADFALLETYSYQARPPLPCPIHAYGGEQDPEVAIADLSAWQPHTQSEFTLELFPGDHFFLHSEQGGLLRSLVQHLS